MSLRVALQIDPIETLSFRTDTSLLLGREAQRRGHRVCYYTPATLSLLKGEVVARGWNVTLHDDAQHHYTREEAVTLRLKDDADVVLLRQDPPFDMHYLTTTYLLERLAPHTLVTNDPFHVRNAPEKLFPLQFAEFMPETLISADVAQIESFRAEMGDIVIKPLYGHAGNAIFKLAQDDHNFHSLLEFFFHQSPLPVMAQRFLPEVRESEVRIILIDGIVRGVMKKIPVAHEIRTNLRFGGHVETAEPTPRQQALCEALGPELRARGLLLAGVDMIGDWLTEINITSPTGLPGMNRLYGANLERHVWDAIEKRL